MNGFTVPFVLAMLLNLLVLACGVYDAIAVFSNPPRLTISAVIQDWAFRFPVLPFLVGMICGHLFFPTHVVAMLKV